MVLLRMLFSNYISLTHVNMKDGRWFLQSMYVISRIGRPCPLYFYTVYILAIVGRLQTAYNTSQYNQIVYCFLNISSILAIIM